MKDIKNSFCELEKVKKEVSELKKQLHEKVMLKRKLLDKMYKPIIWKNADCIDVLNNILDVEKQIRKQGSN